MSYATARGLTDMQLINQIEEVDEFRNNRFISELIARFNEQEKLNEDALELDAEREKIQSDYYALEEKYDELDGENDGLVARIHELEEELKEARELASI